MSAQRESIRKRSNGWVRVEGWSSIITEVKQDKGKGEPVELAKGILRFEVNLRDT